MTYIRWKSNCNNIFHFKLPPTPLLPPRADEQPTVELDLDETLVHASLSHLPGVDLNIFPSHTSRLRRQASPCGWIPTADALVLFTASRAHYANDVPTDWIQPEKSCQRDFSTVRTFSTGNHVKNLRMLERPFKRPSLTTFQQHTISNLGKQSPSRLEWTIERPPNSFDSSHSWRNWQKRTTFTAFCVIPTIARSTEEAQFRNLK